MKNIQQIFNNEMKSMSDEFGLDYSRVAVAVSGGADSMALLNLLNGYIKEKGGKLTALCVNHHLRAEADEEAAYVKEFSQSIGVDCQILDWEHEPLETGIETKARSARYDLMTRWCADNDYPVLFVAHHLRDQAETFLIRLQRGSGVDGLAAMSKTIRRNGIVIARPLLYFDPRTLRDYLVSQNIEWKEDASNQCTEFLRVRVRNILPILERELGLSLKKIGTATKAMAETKKMFIKYVDEFIRKRCRNTYGCGWRFKPQDFDKLESEVKFRVLAELIRQVGKSEYPPEYEALKRLQDAIMGAHFRGSTLGGCEILRFNDLIWITKESKNTETLSKEQWREYTALHPEVLKFRLPYKLRLNLVKKNKKK